MSSIMTARAARPFLEAAEARWTELNGPLGEAQASIELLHERGLIADEVFWEALAALRGMFQLIDDVLGEIRDGLAS